MPARHLLCSDPADLRASFLAVWRAWRNPARGGDLAARVHIVAPTRSHRAALKRLLVEAGEPVFNVAFLLPNHLRTLLGEELLSDRAPLWGREELDFLLRRLAEGVDGSTLCRGLAHDPAPLRRALDELAAAGHSPRVLLDDPAHRDLAPLLRAWEPVEARLSPHLRAGRDRRLLKAAQARKEPISGKLLLYGCGARNAADFPLFEAALAAWADPAVLTLLATAGQETVEGPWLDLVAKALPNAETALPEGTPEGETDEVPAPPAPIFHLATGKENAAELIVRQTRLWLREAAGKSTRIGLVFPAASPLASRVSQRLRDSGVPFASGFDTVLPLRFEQSLLRDWLALQRGGLWAEPFLLFWRKAMNVPEFAARFGEPPLWGGELGDRLAEAHRRILHDDVAVLAAVLRGAGKALPALEKFLKWWQAEGLWPERAPLSDFLKRLGAQLDLLVGANLGQPLRGFLAKELSRLAKEWTAPVGRGAACDLLESFVARPEVARDFGDWAPVRLATPDEARALEWDRLLLAEVEEGTWPKLDRPATFLDDGLRERLNRRAQVPSPAGGEETVYADGFGPLPTATAGYRLARETFASLLESARGGCAVTAATWDEAGADRRLHPSEFFRQAWEKDHGPWSDAAEAALLRAVPDEEALPVSADPSVAAMTEAYHARRNGREAFDAFSFMLRSRPLAHSITAKAAEETLRDPAGAWFKHLLKLSGERPAWSPDEEWPLFQGTVLHRIFERSLATFRSKESLWTPVPEPGAWLAALDAEAHRAEQGLRAAFAEAKAVPPPWWESEWPRLRAALHRLHGKFVARLPEGFTHLAAEFELTPPVPTDDPLLPPLAWRSRADLIALDADTPERARRAVVFDFKTGLKADDFDPAQTSADASYFQLVVYAALLRAAHPNLAETAVAILHRGEEKERTPPVPVDPADDAYAPLWTVLREAWLEGRWGQFLALRERFGQNSRLPLATIEVPQNLLAEKWTQTPGLNAWTRGEE